MAKTDKAASAAADEFLNDKDDAITTEDLVNNTPSQKDEITDDDFTPRSKQPRKQLTLKKDPADPRPHAYLADKKLQKKFGSMGLPVSMDVSAAMLPPITRRRYAEYELIQDVKIDPRVTKGDPTVKQPPVILPPTYLFYDRGEMDLGRQQKLMKLVERREPFATHDQGGNPITTSREILASIIFENGIMRVPIREEYPKFVWMELCPWNGSNKWRTQKHLTIFRRIDQNYKSVHQELLLMDLRRDADNHVRSIARDAAALINLASAMTNPTIPTLKVDPQTIYHSLRLRAQSAPEDILFKTPDKKASIRLNLISALDMGIIEYSPDTSSYYGSWTKDKESVFKVNLDAENPLEDLCAFCLTDEGAPLYEDILELLGYWR